MPTVPTAAELADIAAAELALRRTALRERFTVPGRKTVIAAISANGRWGYEKEGGAWVIIDKTGRCGLHFAASLSDARYRTFLIDHPLHDHPRPEPRPVRYEIV